MSDDVLAGLEFEATLDGLEELEARIETLKASLADVEQQLNELELQVESKE